MWERSKNCVVAPELSADQFPPRLTVSDPGFDVICDNDHSNDDEDCDGCYFVIQKKLSFGCCGWGFQQLICLAPISSCTMEMNILMVILRRRMIMIAL